MTTSAIDLLRQIIAIPSFSGEEDAVAGFLESRFGWVQRIGNNLIIYPLAFDAAKPTLMLNSHIDTVRPGDYSFDPFNPPIDSEVVYGLGSNDAGASVVSMVETFKYFNENPRPFNVLLVLSAEEENSGKNGIEALCTHLPNIDCAIIGEPTGMRAAIAERGLLVIDGEAKGISGHAARDEGVNAILLAHDDISVLRGYVFDRDSEIFGKVKMTITRINAGREHNVIPHSCTFTLDIRPNDQYTNKEILELLQERVKSRLIPRSAGYTCSSTPPNHAIMDTIKKTAIESYISPTTSDWVRIGVPAVKMGPGDSGRSHMADEYVLVEEIKGGIEGYINFINNLDL